MDMEMSASSIITTTVCGAAAGGYICLRKAVEYTGNSRSNANLCRDLLIGNLVALIGAGIGAGLGYAAGASCFPKDAEPCLNVGGGVFLLVPATSLTIAIAHAFFPPCNGAIKT